MTNKPVFIFSAGWRSGSTLLQRMLTASNELLVWGEAGGALDCLTEADLGYQQMLAPGNKVIGQGLGGNGELQFVEFCKSDKQGVHRWIPCMNAPLETIRDGFRAFLREVYQEPAAKLGYNRWGVKEVRCGLATAEFLRELYPEAKFVFLVRNPFDCLSSLKRHNWMDRPHDRRALEYYAQHWVRLASEFRKASFGMLVRHEDLVSDAGRVAKLQDYLEMAHLYASFTEKSQVNGGFKSDSSLNWLERYRAKIIVWNEMQHYEYEISKRD
jgi:hypothetical protein